MSFELHQGFRDEVQRRLDERLRTEGFTARVVHLARDHGAVVAYAVPDREVSLVDFVRAIADVEAELDRDPDEYFQIVPVHPSEERGDPEDAKAHAA